MSRNHPGIQLTGGSYPPLLSQNLANVRLVRELCITLRFALAPRGAYVRRKEEVMTEIILTFPVGRKAPLSCVWIETGNPVRPLVCKWISRAKNGADLIATGTVTPENHHCCA